MKRVEFVIKGTPLHAEDFHSAITAFARQHDMQPQLRERGERFILTAEADAARLKSFETALLVWLGTHFDLESYTKRAAPKKPKSAKTTVEEDPIKKIVARLKSAKVIAVREKNGYHIITHAAKIPAVKSLRSIIGCERKPLRLMFRTIIAAERLLLLSQKEKALLSREDAPTLLVRQRRLHRLERAKLRYHFSANMINPLNERVAASLPSGPFYKALFKEADFPIVSIDARTPDGAMITDEAELVKHYGEQFAWIYTPDIPLDQEPAPRPLRQTVYGEARAIDPACSDTLAEGAAGIFALQRAQSDFAGYRLAPRKILLDPDGNRQPAYTALSLLFEKLPLEEIAALDLPFTPAELDTLCSRWKSEAGIVTSDSLIDLFDAVAALSGLITQKRFETESLIMAEAWFEVCEEDLFDYEITDKRIAIDIVSDYLVDPRPKHLFSTLTNTLSTIITDIAAAEGADATLCGRIFGYRDLTELTIEKLQDANIGVRY